MAGLLAAASSFSTRAIEAGMRSADTATCARVRFMRADTAAGSLPEAIAFLRSVSLCFVTFSGKAKSGDFESDFPIALILEVLRGRTAASAPEVKAAARANITVNTMKNLLKRFMTLGVEKKPVPCGGHDTGSG